MRSRWNVTLSVVVAVLLVPTHEGKTWVKDRCLVVASLCVDRTAPTMVSDRPQSLTPLRVAAQARVEPVSEVLELAIGTVGTLAKVYVDEGDAIKQGQLLAEL